MSVIVVKNNKDFIELASDTQETYSETDMQLINWCKIKKINDKLHVGAVGNAHITNLFFAYIEKYSIEEIKKSIDLIEYFGEFYNWASNIVSSTGQIEDMASILGNCQFIIIIDKDIWQFNNFYIRKINQLDEYAVIGSGSTPAIVALQTGNTVEKAIEIACNNNVYCSMPINTLIIKK